MSAAEQDPAAGLLLVGLSHRSASLEIREQLYQRQGDAGQILAELRSRGFSEALVLCTCDRLEIFLAAEPPADARISLTGVLADWMQLERTDFEQHSYRLEGEAAVRHLFAVAASLDSQIIGEPQILGQVKEAHRQAVAAGLSGPALEAVLRAAFATAKRIRHETPLAERPVTIAAAAVQVARNLHGDLSRCRALLAGLAEIGELLALEFKEAGLAHLVVSHGHEPQAAAAAQRLNCNLVAWDELENALVEADILVAARGSGRYSITSNGLREALRRRRQRPVFIIDCAVPSDLDPAVERLESAFVYSLDDLERVAMRGQASRQSHSGPAWEILEQELARFFVRAIERAAGPAVTSLRRHFERTRQDVLSKGRPDAETATRQLINRLLHDPSEVLRQAVAQEGAEGTELKRALERLFRITGKDRSKEDET